MIFPIAASIVATNVATTAASVASVVGSNALRRGSRPPIRNGSAHETDDLGRVRIGRMAAGEGAVITLTLDVAELPPSSIGPAERMVGYDPRLDALAAEIDRRRASLSAENDRQAKAGDVPVESREPSSDPVGTTEERYRGLCVALSNRLAQR